MTTVYVTVPRDEADDLARTLVKERLAACVNRVDCESTYRWQETVHEDEEAILLVKTTAERYEPLCDRVVELHPHEVPCVERFDEADVFAAFATWRAESVEPPGPQ